jgi:peptide/nickel transport system substrate-binding protein
MERGKIKGLNSKKTKLQLAGRQKLRFSLNLIKEFFKRRYKLLLLGFFLGIIFSLIIPFFLDKNPFLTKAIKIGIIGKYTIDEIPDEIQPFISRGLTRVGEDGEIIPDLAESWQTEDKGKKYIFKLQKGLTWVDGKPFTAHDVNYNFEDAQMEIDNDYQITFSLKDTFSPFPLAVSKPIFRKGLVGLGNFRIKKIEFNGKFVQLISLEPMSSQENSTKIIFKFYPSEEAAKLAIKLGEVTNLDDVLEVKGLENFSNLNIKSEVSFNRFAGLFFNTEEPFLEDKLFRQALAYALKKDFQNRALVPISPQNWAFFSEVKSYDYNLTKAKELMENSLEEIEPSEIQLTIQTVPQLLALADEIKNDWEELGLNVEIGPFTPGQMEFQVLLAVQEIPIDPDQYSLWHSTSQNNITRLRSPRIDKLLEDGRVTLDQDERKSIYFDFQKYLAEEIPVIFLYYPEVFSISRK